MRPDNIRKNQGVGFVTSQASQGLNVVAPSFVQARQTDPSGVVNALNDYADRKKHEQAQLNAAQAREAARLAEIDRQDKEELTGAQARSDVTQGTVDQSRMTDRVYLQNAQMQEVENRFLKVSATAANELDVAMEEEGFDFNEWYQGTFNKGALDPSTLSGKALAKQNGFHSQLLQQTSAHYESRKRDLFDEKAEAGYEQLLRFTVLEGNRSPADLEAIEAKGAGIGLTEAEISEKSAKAVYQAYKATGNPEYYKLAEKTGMLYSDYGDNFIAQKRVNEEKAAAAAEAKRAQDAMQAVQDHIRWSTDATNGNLDLQEVVDAKNAGYITQAKVNSYATQQLNAMAAKTKEATTVAEKAAKEQAIVDSVSAEFGNGADSIALYLAKYPEHRDDLTKYANKRHAIAIESVGQAAVMPKGPERDVALGRATTNLTDVMHQAHAANMLPSFLDDTFSGISLGAPQRLKQLSASYEAMKAAGLGELIRDNIPVSSYMKLETFSDMAEIMGEDEALRAMSLGSRKIEDVVKMVDGMAYRELREVTQKLNKKYDTGDAGVIENAIYQVATVALMQGADPEKVPALAEKYFNEAFTVFEGRPIPRSHLAGAGVDEESFKTAVPTYVESVLLPEIQKIAGIKSVTLHHMQGRPGYFSLKSPDIANGTVTRADGSAWVVNARDMIEQAGPIDAEKRAQWWRDHSKPRHR